MLYSTSYATYGQELIQRQLLWLALGTIGAFVIRYVDYRLFARFSPLLLLLLGGSLLYLALANLCYDADVIPKTWFGYLPLLADSPTKGSYRWLHFGFASVQPSTFAQVAIILFLADYWNRHARHILEFWRGFAKPLGGIGLVVLLILSGGDLSTTVITGALVFALSFIAGVRLRYLMLALCAGGLVAGMAIMHNPERMSRLTGFRDPQLHKYEEGYQLWSSQLALGSGGWTGVGFTESRMKQNYLPEAPTDFIVAILGEELGFIGVMALLAGYAAFFIVACRIAAAAVDRTGMFIAVGIGMSTVLHAFVNLSVASGYGPTTGVTAPFLSYGGSSLVVCLAEVGLLLSILRISGKQTLEEEMQAAVQPTPAVNLARRKKRNK